MGVPGGRRWARAKPDRALLTLTAPYSSQLYAVWCGGVRRDCTRVPHCVCGVTCRHPTRERQPSRWSALSTARSERTSRDQVYFINKTMYVSLALAPWPSPVYDYITSNKCECVFHSAFTLRRDPIRSTTRTGYHTPGLFSGPITSILVLHQSESPKSKAPKRTSRHSSLNWNCATVPHVAIEPCTRPVTPSHGGRSTVRCTFTIRRRVSVNTSRRC